MRKSIIVLLCLAGILLVGYAGYRGYQVSKQSRMMRLAREFLAKSDPQNALLCVRQVLRSNPEHLEACRLMAQLSEAGRSPGALLWRNRVVELNPHSVEDRLALAQTALIFRDYRAATNALEGVDRPGRQTFGYHNVAGTVALVSRQTADAEAHFREAARLEPSNLIPQLNLAVAQLQSSNELDLAEARIGLRRISLNPTNANLRSQALKELVNDALRFKDSPNALALSKELVRQTNAVFSDRLLNLEVLRQTRSPELKSTLAVVQHDAAQGTNAQRKIFELATWQMAQIPPAETLSWLQSLPPGIRTNQPAALLIAECLTSLKDWKAMHSLLASQNWAELDFVRHAYLTHCLRGEELMGAAKGEWELALKMANANKGSMTMLLRLAAQWNWSTEAEDLLWAIVKRYPEEKWAAQALTQALYAGGRTRPLMMFFNQEQKRSPGNLEIKNNLAVTALLLEANELKPHELAREIYQAAPTNAAFASTYAFSLHVQSKDAEALKIMQTLSPKALEDPSIAGYYGVILKATGNPEKAKIYLNWAIKSRLLPEERTLFERAKAGS
jgi:predicted Zn-dependent protease